MADVSTIGEVKFDLTMTDAEGNPLTATVYVLPGLVNPDGSARLLSIGQLVMALCLQRAAAMEQQIIKAMNDIEETSKWLKLVAAAEEKITEAYNKAFSQGSDRVYNRLSTYGIANIEWPGRENGYPGWAYFLDNALGIDIPTKGDDGWNSFDAVDAALTQMEQQMDDKNSISQQTMIQLQSDTSKRDQAYDMIANILKSLSSTNIAILNNAR